MFSLLAPAASNYLTALGQQSLFDLYNPGGTFHHHNSLGLAPLVLDHASLLKRASLLNHPSPLLHTARFDFSTALQQQSRSRLVAEQLDYISHLLDPILDHRLGADNGEELVEVRTACDPKAQAKRADMANLAGILRALESAQSKMTRSARKAHQMSAELRYHLEAAHVAEAGSCWHEVGGDALEATLRLPGFEISEIKAVLSDPRHLTMTMTMTDRGKKGYLEQTVALPFAVRDPAAVELVHDEKGGALSVRLAKPAEEATPGPVALPIVTLAMAEPEKTKAAAGADQKVAQDKSDEQQLNERFADVVAARAAANGAAAKVAAEAAAAEVAAEAA
eukprot:CAMPEP_0119055712 /NCGR_PEP_ID=MMETSP1178-20130426/73_1 /TAXON_ID=33656 /ORGANISM="unid sp, Strain CCMP2000" /LENGTH=335 /DNA_ID=CAMNT_0007036327 /DNA_START=87 /DNA_END=1091 /DNA_ORIENTATION=-